MLGQALALQQGVSQVLRGVQHALGITLLPGRLTHCMSVLVCLGDLLLGRLPGLLFKGLAVSRQGPLGCTDLHRIQARKCVFTAQ
ncbi:hypothetical protein D3C84_1075100 [compost metagenome]